MRRRVARLVLLHADGDAVGQVQVPGLVATGASLARGVRRGDHGHHVLHVASTPRDLLDGAGARRRVSREAWIVAYVEARLRRRRPAEPLVVVLDGRLEEEAPDECEFLHQHRAAVRGSVAVEAAVERRHEDEAARAVRARRGQEFGEELVDVQAAVGRPRAPRYHVEAPGRGSVEERRRRRGVEPRGVERVERLRFEELVARELHGPRRLLDRARHRREGLEGGPGNALERRRDGAPHARRARLGPAHRAFD
mmetsp:Transcript_21613/g.64709  ORF Transcript_21613/g.64709 Transcript_21613/m.64709 type:complete len:253 (+) Transcript_21613:83-841(+)